MVVKIKKNVNKTKLQIWYDREIARIISKINADDNVIDYIIALGNLFYCLMNDFMYKGQMKELRRIRP